MFWFMETFSYYGMYLHWTQNANKKKQLAERETKKKEEEKEKQEKED